MSSSESEKEKASETRQSSCAPSQPREKLSHDEDEKDVASAASFHTAGSLERGPSDVVAADNAQRSTPPPPSPPSGNDGSSTTKDPMLVEFTDPTDPENPKNWSIAKRIGATVSTAMLTFVVTFASTIFSVAIGPVAEEFHIGTVTSTLGVSLFLLGFVLGPIAFGPASEVYGRRGPLLLGFAVFALFQIPVALAPDAATILVFRFLGGFAACAPLAILGGVLADLWMPIERAYGVCFTAFMAFAGPVVGPIVGGFVTESYLGWRWTAWLTLIAAGAFGGLAVVALPETSGARILQRRARRLRKETGNPGWRAKADEEKVTVKRIFSVYLMRPWKMLAGEPILALLTAYMSFVYGVLYLLFEAFPVSFRDERHWSLGVSNLPYCSFIVGVAFGTGLMSYSTATNFKRAYVQHGKCIPEERLPPMMVGAIVLPIGFFWFGWTSFSSITWVPQVISVALIGFGEVVVFWEGMAYMIDCYGFYSNSAIAVNTFIRSIAAAAFPLFASYMYKGIGVPWASSLLGFLSLAFVPAPFLFYKYGAKIRSRSQWAPTG